MASDVICYEQLQKIEAVLSQRAETLVLEENLSTKPLSHVLISPNTTWVSYISSQSEDLVFHLFTISLKSI